MDNLLQPLMRKERGQALAIVLALLAIGGLTIAVTLNYATTNLRGTGIDEENLKGIYAASSGVENSLWYLNNGNNNPPTSIPNVNGMTVNINTNVGTDTMTLYIDDLTEGVHGGYVTVTNNITPAGGNIYNYTIVIVIDPSGKPNSSLTEIGAKLPNGYTYVQDSWNGTNLSYHLQGSVPNPQLGNPNATGFLVGGAQWLRWIWSNKGPNISANSTYTQKFQITGTGNTGGSYAWVKGGSEDIGTVGQITGVLTTVNATARRPVDGKITGRVVVNAIKGSAGLYVLSWQISK